MIPLSMIQEAATVIRQGGLVAFPTETYYGLAVDPFDEAALAKVFSLKQRPESKPLLTLINHQDQLCLLTASVPPCLVPLMELWPAPLTLVFPAGKALSDRLTAGTGTIGVRISPHPIASQLVALCGQPITATSANLSGAPPAHTAQEVMAQFPRGIDYVLDGGRTAGGAGSTLVGCVAGRPVLLRRGVLPPELLSSLL